MNSCLHKSHQSSLNDCFNDICFAIIYPMASATVYGRRPKFFRAEHSATAEGENCTYGPTLTNSNSICDIFAPNKTKMLPFFCCTHSTLSSTQSKQKQQFPELFLYLDKFTRVLATQVKNLQLPHPQLLGYFLGCRCNSALRQPWQKAAKQARTC